MKSVLRETRETVNEPRHVSPKLGLLEDPGCRTPAVNLRAWRAEACIFGVGRDVSASRVDRVLAFSNRGSWREVSFKAIV